MLFKTTEEIQAYLPVAVTFEFSTIARFLQEAEWENLLPVLGEEQYNALQIAYEAQNLTTDEQRLLDLCRYAVSSFAYMKYIPWGQVQINASGIQIVSNENMKTAFQWQIEDLQGSALRSGHAAMERLVLFLLVNARQFPAWLSSSAYTDLHKYFITNATDFSRFAGRMFDRYAFLQMQHLLDDAHKRLRKILSANLYNELHRQQLKNSLTAANETLIELCRPALAHYTVARSVNNLSIIVTPQGITTIDDKDKDRRKNFRAAPDTKLQVLQEEANTAAEAAFEEIREFLQENHFDYPAYPYQKPTEAAKSISKGGVAGFL